MEYLYYIFKHIGWLTLRLSYINWLTTFILLRSVYN